MNRRSQWKPRSTTDHSRTLRWLVNTPRHLQAHTSATERLAMVWPLTLTSSALAEREIPDYKREDMGTFLRSGAPV